MGTPAGCKPIGLPDRQKGEAFERNDRSTGSCSQRPGLLKGPPCDGSLGTSHPVFDAQGENEKRRMILSFNIGRRIPR